MDKFRGGARMILRGGLICEELEKIKRFNGKIKTKLQKSTHESTSTGVDPPLDKLDPMKMTYEQLKEITNGLSHEVGRGTFGVVYKGVDKDGQEIAVKLLDITTSGVDDKKFLEEFDNLTRLKHQNIVKLVGVCNEAEEVTLDYEGKTILAQRIHRALCFEYMRNGSLEKHLYDEHQGFGWRERYKIIKGICEGLKHLHMGLERPVYHLDLKPDNILLDNNMVPKIADFGLSRLLGEDSTIKTITPVGTLGYQPLEFINNQIISTKFDIYSLGVIIIKMMCGTEGYSSFNDKRPDEFINLVHRNWTKRLQAIIGFGSPQGDFQEVKECEMVRYTSLERERDCQQVKKCLEIALKCIAKERETRPNIGYIVHQLEETEKDTIKMEEGLICCTQEIVLRLVLYLHQFNPSGPNRNEEEVVHTNYVHRFGLIIADDWVLTPTSDPIDTIVARAQGLHMQAGKKEDNQWYKSFNLVFEDHRFAGSTLQVMGRTTAERNGEWSIVGGTGQFRRAKGTIEFTCPPDPSPYHFLKKLDIEIFYTPRTS